MYGSARRTVERNGVSPILGLSEVEALESIAKSALEATE